MNMSPIFLETVDQAKKNNANISESDLLAIVEEAVKWPRIANAA